MLTWNAFADLRPDLAAQGRKLFYGHGIGLGFLATVRRDGGPRVHPICPLFADRGLYAFIVPGPKLNDLHRDPRYSLHCETFPPPDHDDAFMISGEVQWVDDDALRPKLTRQFLAERQLGEPWPGFDQQELVEFAFDRCLLTLTNARDDLSDGHTVWREERAPVKRRFRQSS
jgi:Pyridoxamine 5'-phosphate oxidase